MLTLSAPFHLRLLSWAVACVVLGPSAAGAARADDDPPQVDIDRGGIEWSAPDEGFERAATQRTPIFLAVSGEDPARFWVELKEKKLLDSSRIRSRLKGFATVEATMPLPKSVKERIGGVDGTALVLLDFRGRVQARWDGEIPSRTEFSRELKRVLVTQARLVERIVKVEKLLEKSLYALKLEKNKEAVLFLLEAGKVELPVDSPLHERRRKIREQIDEIVVKERKKAEELEEADKLAEAVVKYEAILQEFPFPELQDELRRKIGELWRRINWGG